LLVGFDWTKEHDTIDITTSQIKSVAPFPPVINDLNFGLVGPGPQPGQNAPICPSKRGDNEFKRGPQFAIGKAYLTCYITTTWEACCLI
jgi:hypothetical protein